MSSLAPQGLCSSNTLAKDNDWCFRVFRDVLRENNIATSVNLLTFVCQLYSTKSHYCEITSKMFQQLLKSSFIPKSVFFIPKQGTLRRVKRYVRKTGEDSAVYTSRTGSIYSRKDR